MSNQFNKEKFESAFAVSVEALRVSERTTKAELMALSRLVLEAVHATENIAYVNDLLAVLTPMNKQTAELYFAEFSGFHMWEGKFSKKDKKNYDAVKQKALEFLADPLNNIWTWATRNVKVEPKEFDLSKVTKSMETFMKKADKENMSQADVLRAVFKAGFKLDALIVALSEVDGLSIAEPTASA